MEQKLEHKCKMPSISQKKQHITENSVSLYHSTKIFAQWTKIWWKGTNPIGKNSGLGIIHFYSLLICFSILVLKDIADGHTGLETQMQKILLILLHIKGTEWEFTYAVMSLNAS